MNYISIKHLKAFGACKDQTQKFQETFGSSVKFDSLEEAKEIALKYAQEFNFEWIGQGVFGEAYLEASASLWKAYQEAEAPIWKTYEEARAPLWKTYEEARAPLWEAYREGCAKLFAKMWWESDETGQKLKESLGEPE